MAEGAGVGTPVDAPVMGKTDLCNLGLIILGGTTDIGTVLIETAIAEGFFTDWTTGITETDKMCAFCYPYALKEALSRHDWDFAREYEDLGTELATANLLEGADWNYQFSLPSDFIRLIDQVSEADHTLKYRHELRYNINTDRWCLLTNDYSNSDGDSAFVDYISYNNDPDTYPPSFVKFFATILASWFAAWHRDMISSDKLLNRAEKLLLPTARKETQKHTYRQPKTTVLQSRTL